MWALHKHFPNVKIYVRAHDVMHGLNLEKVRAHYECQQSLRVTPYTSRGEAYPVRTWLSSWNRAIHPYMLIS